MCLIAGALSQARSTKTMKKKIFTIAALQMSLFFWAIESAIHFFVFNEPRFEIIPGEMNELWMRIVIVFLIMILGVFADAVIVRIRRRQLEVAHTYGSMIQTSRHILINIINQMQLFKLEAQKSKDFDQDVIRYYDSAIKEASDLVDTLSKVREATEEQKRKLGVGEVDETD